MQWQSETTKKLMYKNRLTMIHEAENHFRENDGKRVLLRELGLLESKMQEAVRSHQNIIRQLDPAQQSSCNNLLYYLALRSEDIRDLQNRLHVFGLSSLASSESHIYSQLNAILERLGKNVQPDQHLFCSYQDALHDIQLKSQRLFGEKKEVTVPYIMVTLDEDHADNYEKVKELLLAGMNVARINCAHDDESVWTEIIENIHRAVKESGLACKIYMDLSGPKIRTFFPGKTGKKHKIEVKEGGHIYISDREPDHDDRVVGCSIRGIVRQLKEGERVLFDDGSIECLVEKKEEDRARLKVVRISRGKPFIKSEKGINFPDSTLDISSLTEFDRECLPFICENADLIGYSFVRTAEDLAGLQKILKSQCTRELFIILKIETQEAVINLPSLLIQGMHSNAFGVMIARGDLAIEVGFERMSEVQEEILWICEAAHVPVIWATQVLDTLNKSGQATRSEITDATYSGLAECVMINKGEHTRKVIESLTDILLRGGSHHIKKRYTFRPLNIAKSYLSSFLNSSA
jgi:pyruvate kinase